MFTKPRGRVALSVRWRTERVGKWVTIEEMHLVDRREAVARSLTREWGTYHGSVRDACRQEIRSLKQHAATPSGHAIDALSARSLLRWLRLYSWDWRARRPITRDTLVRRDKLLHTVYSMRQELSELRSRSGASTDQLLKQLCDWRERAESSGIAALREFARRLPQLV